MTEQFIHPRHRTVTVAALLTAVQEGASSAQVLLGVTSAQVQRLASLDESTLLLPEEVQPRIRPRIELNIGSDADPRWSRCRRARGPRPCSFSCWRATRCRCSSTSRRTTWTTASSSTASCPRLRDSKSRRQILLSSHNANIPVLADADLIAAMDTERADGRLHAVLPPERCASIDDASIRHLVEELLEGGREAFQNRRYRYGF